MGTAIERRFFNTVRTFYETCVAKMIEKFPFNDNTIQELAFLDPRNRDKTSLNGSVQLANRFVSYSTDKLDSLNMEFRDYHVIFRQVA